MTEHAPFAVVLHEHRQHIVHRYPAYEDCNLDDSVKRVYLDSTEVSDLIGSGKARYCEHCHSEDVVG